MSDTAAMNGHKPAVSDERVDFSTVSESSVPSSVDVVPVVPSPSMGSVGVVSTDRSEDNGQHLDLTAYLVSLGAWVFFIVVLTVSHLLN